MNETPEMFPCFCGAQPTTWWTDIHVGVLWWAGCEACGRRIKDDYYVTEEEAIREWNRCVENGNDGELAWEYSE